MQDAEEAEVEIDFSKPPSFAAPAPKRQKTSGGNVFAGESNNYSTLEVDDVNTCHSSSEIIDFHFRNASKLYRCCSGSEWEGIWKGQRNHEYDEGMEI